MEGPRGASCQPWGMEINKLLQDLAVGEAALLLPAVT